MTCTFTFPAIASTQFRENEWKGGEHDVGGSLVGKLIKDTIIENTPQASMPKEIVSIFMSSTIDSR